VLSIPEASSRAGFWMGLSRLEAEIPRVVAEAVRLAEVPSPTGSEERRAALTRDLLADSLEHAVVDQAGNVVACVKGVEDRPGTVVLAPLDSWYGPETNPLIDVRADRLTGPGIVNHAIALSSMIALARTLQASPVTGLGDIWFVGTVGSEMAGDLRGICHLFPWLPTVASRVLCLQGPGIGRLDHWSVGTYRGELNVYAPGGHCWRDAGRSSALQLAMEFSQRLNAIPKAVVPRTLYNPAQLQSGDAWNTLASKATLKFELRSDSEEELQRLIIEAQKAAQELCRGHAGCRAQLEQMGFRHATGLYPDHALVTGIREAQSWAGLASKLGASSSDASVCLYYGVAAATIGLCNAVGIETMMETLYLDSLPSGLRQAYAATIQIAGRNSTT